MQLPLHTSTHAPQWLKQTKRGKLLSLWFCVSCVSVSGLCYTFIRFHKRCWAVLLGFNLTTISCKSKPIEPHWEKLPKIIGIWFANFSVHNSEKSAPLEHDSISNWCGMALWSSKRCSSLRSKFTLCTHRGMSRCYNVHVCCDSVSHFPPLWCTTRKPLYSIGLTLSQSSKQSITTILRVDVRQSKYSSLDKILPNINDSQNRSWLEGLRSTFATTIVG